MVKLIKFLRPMIQDLAVLLKISISENNWLNKEITKALNISQAEVSYSLQRSANSGLIDPSKRKVFKSALLEFIKYGFPHVFPAIKGPMAVGIPTAWPSPFVAKKMFLTSIWFGLTLKGIHGAAVLFHGIPVL